MNSEVVGGIVSGAILLVGFGVAGGIIIGAKTQPVTPPPASPPPAIQEFDYHLRDGRTMPCLQTPTTLDCDWWDAKPIPPPMMPVPLPAPNP